MPEITYELSASDVDEWLADVRPRGLGRSPVSDRVDRMHRLARTMALVLAGTTAIAVPGLATLFTFESATPGQSWELLLVIGLPVGAAVALFVFRRTAALKSAVDAGLASNDVDAVERPPDFTFSRTLRVSTDGIEERSPWGTKSLSWAAFGDIVDSSAGVGFLSFSNGVLLIPQHAFESEEDRVRFFDAVSSLWWRAGGPEAMHRAYLQDRSMSCTGCGYELRDVATMTCPECGKDNEVSSLRFDVLRVPQTPDVKLASNSPPKPETP